MSRPSENSSAPSDERNDFLTIGEYIWRAHNELDEPMETIADRMGMGIRKAYYLAEVFDCFDRLPVPRDRLLSVGWKKLQMLSDIIDQDNFDELIELAAKNPVHRIKDVLDGVQYAGRKHALVLNFTDEQYNLFKDILLAHGAKPGARGRGLKDKEKAIENLLRSLPTAAQKQP